MSTGSLHPPFVGRQTELQRLVAALAPPRTGPGSCALITGEAGSGKSRLLDEVTRRATAAGWLVLTTRITGEEQALPYRPLIAIIEHYRGRIPGGELRRPPGADAPEVARFLTALSADNTDHLYGAPANWLAETAASLPTEPGIERQRLFEGLTACLRSMATAEAGLVLAIDDLQRADTATLTGLLYLMRRLGELPIHLLVTIGLPEAETRCDLKSWLATVTRQQLGQRLALAPMSVTDIGELLVGLTGGPVAATVTEQIARAGAGNPLFCLEIMRHYIAQGGSPVPAPPPPPATALPPALATDTTMAGTGPATRTGLAAGSMAREMAGGVPVDWGEMVPIGIRQVIDEQVAQLSPTAQSFLPILAILGGLCPPAVLAEVGGLTITAVLDALEEALVVGIIREDSDGIVFSHPLAQRVLAARTSRARRQWFHQCAGELIERLYAADAGPYLARLAEHYSQAGDDPGLRTRAITAAHEAGLRALAHDEPEEALGHLQQALTWLERRERPDHIQWCDLLLSLSEAQRRTGQTAAARTALGRAAALARQAGLAEHLAHAALSYRVCGELAFGQVDQVQVGLLQEALAAIGESASSLRARLLAGLAQALVWADRLEETRALSREALAIAGQINDPATLMAVLQLMPAVIWGPDDLDQRQAVAARLLALATATSTSEPALQGYIWRVAAELERGHRPAVASAIETIVQLAGTLGHRGYGWYAAHFQALQALIDGRFDEVEPLLASLLERGQRSDSLQVTMTYGAQLFQLRRDQGRLVELRELVASQAESTATLPIWRCGLALIMSECEPAAAQSLLDALVPTRLTDLPADSFWLASLSLLADVAANLGDQGQAERLLSLLDRYADRVAVVGAGVACLGAVARPLGRLAALLGRWSVAEGYFETALAHHRQLGAPVWLAQTAEEYAQALLRRGQADDRPRARGLLARAISLYRTVGLAERARRANGYLNDLIAGWPAHPEVEPIDTGPSGLSARETEVLRLLAAGQSNLTIAAHLSISPHTVARHVSRIFDKTGSNNRAEAAVFAVQRGLLAERPLPRS